MVRVALYTRVSTEEQAREGFSLAAQLDRLRLFAAAQGWTVTGEYTDDGASGRNIQRPAYARMMEQADMWDTVLVLKMDRIHRNSRNFMGMMDALLADGKGFASVTESLDTKTAMGRFVMDIIQRIAQLESDQIGERTLVGMEQKAKEGAGGLGGPAPYGYRWQDSKLVVVPEEAAMVRTIFMAHAEGHTAQRIADNFTLMGKRTRQGAPWTYWNVKRILENPVYQGELAWNGIVQPGQHKALMVKGA